MKKYKHLRKIVDKISRKIKKLRRNPRLFWFDFALKRISEFRLVKKLAIETQLVKRYLFSIQKRRLFSLCFVTPLIAFSIYTVVFRQGLYESQASIILKSSTVELSGGASGMAPQMVVLEYIQDLFLLKEYIESYDMLEALDAKLKLKKRYRGWRIDMLSRYNGFHKRHFLRYYNGLVHIKIDRDTGIMTIFVSDTNPKFAQALLVEIINVSEQYINNLNVETNNKKSFILNEMSRSIKDKILETRTKMQEYQSAGKTLNAKREIEGLTEILVVVEGDLIKEKTKLAELSSYMDSDSIQIKAAQDKITAIERKLSNIKTKLIRDDKDKDGKYWSMHFASLEVELELFLKEYGSILGLIERVRSNIIAQTKYLIITQQPFLPDFPKYPRFIYNILLCAIILSLFYMILQSTINFIKEYD